MRYAETMRDLGSACSAPLLAKENGEGTRSAQLRGSDARLDARALVFHVLGAEDEMFDELSDVRVRL